MNPEQVQELIDRLFEIAGAAASRGWEIALRQVYVEIAQNAVVLMLGLGLLAVGAYCAKCFAGLANRYDEGEGLVLFLAAAVGICGGVAGIIAGTISIVSRLINPEWYAVLLLLRLAQ